MSRTREIRIGCDFALANIAEWLDNRPSPLSVRDMQFKATWTAAFSDLNVLGDAIDETYNYWANCTPNRSSAMCIMLAFNSDMWMLFQRFEKIYNKLQSLDLGLSPTGECVTARPAYYRDLERLLVRAAGVLTLYAIQFVRMLSHIRNEGALPLLICTFSNEQKYLYAQTWDSFDAREIAICTNALGCWQDDVRAFRPGFASMFDSIRGFAILLSSDSNVTHQSVLSRLGQFHGILSSSPMRVLCT